MAESFVKTRAPVSDRVQTAGEIAEALGCAAALLSSAVSVRWAGGEGALLMVTGDHATPVEPAPDAVRRALLDAGIGPGEAVAIERDSLTVELAGGLGNRRCPDAGELLAPRRARKDPDEIALIESAAELVAVGQSAVREAAVPGATELDLWLAAQAAMQPVAGTPVEAAVDLMAGARTALVGASPTAHAADDGDPVLFDLSPRRDGYWADSCATFACGGTPGSAMRRRHDAVRRALDRGLAEARAGATAGGVDATIRAQLDRSGLACPHHTGHGVGAAPQEAPWLVPGDPTVLEEGMVIAIEPGAYAGGFGVRLEHVALIEADGTRPLTTHALDP
jgi:Xaa-Pro dipeptidase